MLAVTFNPLIGAALPLAAASDPKNILNGAQTYAGRHADSIGTYAAWRVLEGLTSKLLFSQAMGHQIFNYDPAEAATRFKYEVLAASPDEAELKTAFSKTHGRRIWRGTGWRCIPFRLRNNMNRFIIN